MVRLFSALLALSCSLFVAASDGDGSSDDFADFAVKYVTAEEMDSLQKDSSFFVAFVSQKCPHCRRLLDSVPEIRSFLAKGNSKVDFLAMDVNVETNHPFTNQFEVKNVPTIYYFHKDRKPMLYIDNRERASIVAYAEKIANFKVEPLTTVEELEKFKRENPQCAVVLVPENESEEWLQRVRDLAFLTVPQPVATVVRGSAASEGLNDQLYVFIGERSSSMPPGEFDKLSDEQPPAASYAKFIKRAVLPAVSSFPSHAVSMFAAEIPSIAFYISSGAVIEESREWLSKLGEEYRGKLVVATIAREDEGVSHALEFFGLSTDDKNVTSVRIFNAVINKVFAYNADGEITLESLSQWIEDYIAGKVSAHVKSQQLPEDWDQNALKTLVATNFDEVVIAEIDATTNDVDDNFKQILGYPTLRLYKADTNEVVEYLGEGNLDGFVKFVEKQTKEEEAATSEESSREEL